MQLMKDDLAWRKVQVCAFVGDLALFVSLSNKKERRKKGGGVCHFQLIILQQNTFTNHTIWPIEAMWYNSKNTFVIFFQTNVH